MRQPPDPQTKVVKRKPKKKSTPVPGQTGAGSGPSPAPKPVVVKAAGPPNFPTKVPVRPGAPTNRFSSEPSSQAQRTHVHKVRAQRTKLIQKKPDFPTATTSLPVTVKPKGVSGPAILWSKDPAALAAAGFKPEGLAEKIARLPTAAVANAPKDLAELAVTTPSSVAKLASTAVHDPKKVPGMLAAPYVELAKHPVDFVTEHPVTTALMLDPAVKMPGRVVGKVSRLAGKQTLERPAAVLPGTPLKEARTGSRDVVVRAVQARNDAKAGTPVMTTKQVERQLDAFYDQSKMHTRRVVRAATRQAKALPEADRQAHIEGAAGGARTQVDKQFAEQFGRTYPSQEAAAGVAQRVPFDAQVIGVDDKFAVVPKVAVDRLRHHRKVGTEGATGAVVMRVTGKLFRGAVLPFSTKWLFGQGAEAGVRSAVAGAGPLSLLREHKVFQALERQAPGKGIEMRQRTSGAGQFGLTGTAREFADGGRTLGEEFEGTGLAGPAAKLTKVGGKAGLPKVRQGFRAYSHVVFNVVNGAIEQTAQRAMAGKAMKTGPLMERRVLGLTDKAIQEAAQGLHATENQVELGRAVGRMYGRYSKFGPHHREVLLYTTPFAPWYANVVTFLAKVLPVDHPVLTAVLADANVVEEEWRKAHHQSFMDPEHVPGFMLGSWPGKGGQVTRLSRYTPFGASADPAQAVADLVLPQYRAVLDPLTGIDFTGRRLKHPGYAGKEFTLAERLAAAVAGELGVTVPGASQVGRITGVTPKLVQHKAGAKVSLKGKRLVRAARKEFDPLMPIGGTPKTSSSGVRVRVPPPDILKGPVVRVKPLRVPPPPRDILK